ncbi:VOC family protein [Povalibacter sp.]|uniref:VOC family protein n=1 Tax=Povalibacter sp. TaxID=1962978 RepID=UPI002F3F195F
MAIQFNHTIVPARDALSAATFLAEILGRDPPRRFGPFWMVSLDNGVTLDFQDSDEAMPIEHYAFLVSEAEFDAIFARIQARSLPYWADPMHTRERQINRNDGGRGLYWNDPNGHYLEIITRPYGSG